MPLPPIRAAIAALAVIASSTAALADGDVTAVVSGKLLTLTGDAESNHVAITSGGATNAFTVTPLDGTTLNGSAAPATFLHVRSIAALMGAGDDRVDFTNVHVAGSVRIRLDDGNDSAYFTGVTVDGRTTVRCGAGTDTVRTDGNSIFYGPVNVRGEAGNDELQFVASQFRDRLHVEGNNDDDHILLSGIVCSETARAEIYAARGFDSCEILNCQFATDVYVDMGPEDDRLRIAGSRFGRDLGAYGGPGVHDALSLEAGNVFVRFQDYNGFEEGQPTLP
jgi:hypothetical protein